MKVDFSTVALILLVVLPGYCAFKVRNLLSPRSFAAKGPTEELASFVALSVLTHIALAWVISAGMAITGIFTDHDSLHWFDWADRTDFFAWLQGHKSFGTLLLSAYFIASCAAGALMGASLALGRLSLLGKLWAFVTVAPRFRGLLRRMGIRGLLGERPIVYDAFTPGLDELSREKLLFVIAELKDGKGFYAGQVSEYTVLQDEEPHKLVLLTNAQFSPNRQTRYVALDCDRLLIDLADVLAVQIREYPNRDVFEHSN